MAVGGNYFLDNCDNAFGIKPWDGYNQFGAMKSFWEAKQDWYPTWKGEEAAMKIDYIRVYQTNPELLANQPGTTPATTNR